MTVIVLALAMLSAHGAHSQDEIPLTNRPSNFSGAAGVYRIEVRAAPTTVQVEDPLTLTVRIVSLETGPWPYPPQRERLRLLPKELESDFFIEPVPEADRQFPAEKAWEFSWRLMPKHETVNKIPALEFIYFHTTAPSDFKAADGASAIALTVSPRHLLRFRAPASARTKFQNTVEDPALLTRSPSPHERLAMLAGGLITPPLVCFAGYFVWWRLFPSAAERLRRRRGRALRTALKQLRKLGSSASPACVRPVFAEYLRLRLELPPGEVTPSEAHQALLKRGLPTNLASDALNTLQRADAALFAPSTNGEKDDFSGELTKLMRDLEVELCSLKSP
jgi:hypothetical protein